MAATLEWGSASSPPLVLLHGFMQGPASWRDVATELSQSFYVLAPDLAPAREREATLSALAATAARALESALEATGHSTAIVVGYSMGGRVACELARSRAQCIGALVLESAGLGPVDQRERQAMHQRNQLLVQRLLGAADMHEVVDYWESLPLFATQRALPDALQQSQRRMRLACNPRQLAWLAQHAGAHTMPLQQQTVSWLGSLSVPVLYIAGVRDDAYVPRASALSQTGVRTVLLDAGHNTHLEAPRAFCATISSL